MTDQAAEHTLRRQLLLLLQLLKLMKLMKLMKLLLLLWLLGISLGDQVGTKGLLLCTSELTCHASNATAYALLAEYTGQQLSELSDLWLSNLTEQAAAEQTLR